MWLPHAVLKAVSALAHNVAGLPLVTIKKRKDFLRLTQHGHKFVTSSFIMLMLPEDSQSAGVEGMRIGYTVTKKMGNAVVRNRIKRRFREAASQVMPQKAKPGHVYVLIARHSALQCPFSTLLRDLDFALTRIGRVKPKI